MLGCAGMTDLCDHIARTLGVPVVDGVTAATLQVQSLVRQRLFTSKRGELALPLSKPIIGLLSPFTLARPEEILHRVA